MIKRLDTLEVATSDLADAASIYEENFGFAVARRGDGRSAAGEGGRAGSLLGAEAAGGGVGEGRQRGNSSGRDGRDRFVERRVDRSLARGGGRRSGDRGLSRRRS